MKVIATALGFYDHKRRREGEVFNLKPVLKRVLGKDGKPVLENGRFKYEVVKTAEAQFSEKWMKHAGEAPKPKAKGAKPSRAEELELAEQIEAEEELDESEVEADASPGADVL